VSDFTSSLRSVSKRPPILKLIISILTLIVVIVLIEVFRNRPASGFTTGFYGENRGPLSQRTEAQLPALSEQPGTWRFGTLNIHMGRSADGKPALARLASIVASVNVIGLQEVNGGGWDGVENYSQMLARIVGNRHWVVAPSKLRWFRPRGGNAIVSDLAVNDVRVNRLAGNRKDHRNIIDVELQIDGTAVRYINTHLTHRNAELRERQFDHAIELFLSSKHAILVADMNMRADDPRMQKLLENPDVVDALAVIARRNNQADLKPATDVDWILLRNLEAVDAGRIAPGISDHPMIWADVRVKPGT